MTTIAMPSSLPLVPTLKTTWQDVDSSFRALLSNSWDRKRSSKCYGRTLGQLAGAPHSPGAGRVGFRWGQTKGKIGFHGGKVVVHPTRVRSLDGHEIALPTWRKPRTGWVAGP